MVKLKTLINEILNEDEHKIYVQGDKEAPKGKKLQTGPRGGKYFIGSAKEKEDYEKQKSSGTDKHNSEPKNNKPKNDSKRKNQILNNHKKDIEKGSEQIADDLMGWGEKLNKDDINNKIEDYVGQLLRNEEDEDYIDAAALVLNKEIKKKVLDNIKKANYRSRSTSSAPSEKEAIDWIKSKNKKVSQETMKKVLDSYKKHNKSTGIMAPSNQDIYNNIRKDLGNINDTDLNFVKDLVTYLKTTTPSSLRKMIDRDKSKK